MRLGRRSCDVHNAERPCNAVVHGRHVENAVTTQRRTAFGAELSDSTPDLR
jgi:hypothetical protein